MSQHWASADVIALGECQRHSTGRVPTSQHWASADVTAHCLNVAVTRLVESGSFHSAKDLIDIISFFTIHDPEERRITLPFYSAPVSQ